MMTTTTSRSAVTSKPPTATSLAKSKPEPIIQTQSQPQTQTNPKPDSTTDDKEHQHQPLDQQLQDQEQDQEHAATLQVLADPAFSDAVASASAATAAVHAAQAAFAEQGDPATATATATEGAENTALASPSTPNPHEVQGEENDNDPAQALLECVGQDDDDRDASGPNFVRLHGYFLGPCTYATSCALGCQFFSANIEPGKPKDECRACGHLANFHTALRDQSEIAAPVLSAGADGDGTKLDDLYQSAFLYRRSGSKKNRKTLAQVKARYISPLVNRSGISKTSPSSTPGALDKKEAVLAAITSRASPGAPPTTPNGNSTQGGTRLRDTWHPNLVYLIPYPSCTLAPRPCDKKFWRWRQKGYVRDDVFLQHKATPEETRAALEAYFPKIKGYGISVMKRPLQKSVLKKAELDPQDLPKDYDPTQPIPWDVARLRKVVKQGALIMAIDDESVVLEDKGFDDLSDDEDMPDKSKKKREKEDLAAVVSAAEAAAAADKATQDVKPMEE